MALSGTIWKQLLYRKIMRIVLRLGRLSIIGSDTLSLERACFHVCAESMRIGCLMAAACEYAVKILPIIKLCVCGDKFAGGVRHCALCSKQSQARGWLLANLLCSSCNIAIASSALVIKDISWKV